MKSGEQVGKREQRKDRDRRQALEIEEVQAALRRCIEETQRLVDESERTLRRHRKEREEGEPNES